MIITSPGNERIKHIRRLRERKYRRETGLFFVEGLRLAAEALDTGASIEQFVFCPALLHSPFGQQSVVRAQQAGIEMIEVNADVFRALSAKDGPQGLAAVVRQAWTSLEQVKMESGRPWVALDAVADPGNLGAILRANDASGGTGVILLDQSTDPFDPAATRASMGAIFNQQVCQADRESFVHWITERRYALVGTSDAASQDYHLFRYPDFFILLMGSERLGLPEKLTSACDHVVSIPMLGKSDSLNLAVATAVVLYEALNQRRDRARTGLQP